MWVMKPQLTGIDARRRAHAAARAAPLPFGQALRRLLAAMREQGRVLALSQVAGSLAFLSMIAIVPMFSIGFAVLTALPVFGQLREALHRFLDGNLFPAAFSETLLSHLAQFSAKAGELSVIGAIAFFVTAFTTLLTVEATLNRIWAADRRRPMALRLTLYWAALTLGPLLLATSLTFNGLVVTQWLRGGELQALRGLWFALVPWLTSFVGLVLLYRLVPATPVRWREAMAGALLASLLFELLRRGIGIYVAQFPSYTIVYGAFAALPLFLLWLFLGWSAVLLGALLAANLRWWGAPDDAWLRRGPAERFDQARAVLQAMVQQLGGRCDAAAPADSLVAIFDGDPRRAAECAGLLVSLGYLTRLVSLTDVVPIDEQPGLRRIGLLAKWRNELGRNGQSTVVDSLSQDPVWAERWAWANDPGELTLRALFDAFWQPVDDSRQTFPSEFLDSPLVPGGAAGSAGGWRKAP